MNTDKNNTNTGRQRIAPVKIITATLAVSLVAACTTPAPPPPPPAPPPPPPVERIPYRPLPPGGASFVMQMPATDAVGQRQTVNSGVSDDERVWHFRSAWNVAALNCTAAQYQPILTAYSAYISDHARGLKRVNDRIESVYRRENGGRRAGLKAREQHMTSVYNYFALPPARAGFCRAALNVSNSYLAAPPSDPVAFANANFRALETPFETFFTDYERYQNLSANWDAQYGARYGSSQPGWVAVQEARRNGVPVPSAQSNPSSTSAQPVASGPQSEAQGGGSN